MAKSLLVINVDIRETRVALIENGSVAELHIERDGSKGTLGNIYVGKVSRVLPGMQAAFIDIGQERAAFLHVEDLIRPDDFEAYLAGKHGTRHDSHGGESSEQLAEAETSDTDAEEDAHAAAEVQSDEARAESADDVADDAAADDAAADNAEDAEDDESAAAADADVDNAARDDESDDERDGADDAEADDSDTNEDEARGRDEADDDAREDDEPDSDESDSDESDSDEGDAPEVADKDPEVVRIAAAPEPAPPPPNAEDKPAKAGRGRRGRGPGSRRSPRPTDFEFQDSEPPPGYTEAPVDAAASAIVDAVAGGEEIAAGDPAKGESAGEGEGKSRTRRGGRGRRRRGRTADAAAKVAAPMPAAPPTTRVSSARAPNRGDRRGERGGDRGGRDRGGRSSQGSTKKDPLRVSKSTPIREVVREGQEVVVQVSKEPIGTKGARVTSHVSLPGRYVVYLPTVEHVGISKRIGSDKERGRLREAIEAMKPPQGGLIVRTLAEGLTKKSLKADVGYLVRLWGEIARKRETTPKAPECLYSELDLILKTARDLFTDDVEKIVIDSKEEHARLTRFIEMFMPERVNAIELYEGSEPIFDEYGIESEIARALSRKVELASGGHLVIDQAEALTAIDVNTGRYVGKGSRDLEETILATNLEAVEEIAYQLRFRNIGGLIILDLIDMERAGNREKVRRRLEQLLAKDKAKTTLNRISELGLIEMTRKRTRESLGRLMNEPCFYCDGTGNLQSRETIAYEILRQIKRDRSTLRGYSVVVNAHPAVVELLRTDERSAVQEAERQYMRRIELVPRKEYHLEQFDLVGK